MIDAMTHRRLKFKPGPIQEVLTDQNANRHCSCHRPPKSNQKRGCVGIRDETKLNTQFFGVDNN